MAFWRIEMLGDLRAVSADRTINRFRTQKTACLLAFLAVHLDRAHPREVLIETLWPESDPDLSRQSLRQALSSLRHQLEPPGIMHGSVLCSDHFSVRLNPNAVTTDVADFHEGLRRARHAADAADRVDALRAAVERYRGELLPGFYEGWIIREQDRLFTLYVPAICDLVHLLLASGARAQAAEAVEVARRALVLYPSSDQIRALLASFDSPPGAPLPPAAPPPKDRKERAGTRARNAPSVPAGNLPPAWTRFFGREREMAHLCRLLSGGERLVTLTGPGGVGKTRLALEVARSVEERFPGAVWFVPLASLGDPALIPEAIRGAMGLPPLADTDTLEQIAHVLARGPALLVLDNFEQLVEGGADAARAILLRIPTVSLLVTSRRTLNLSAEVSFPIAPLPVPLDVAEPERLMHCQSVRLFVDRAQRIRPDFQVTGSNAEALACLCVRLEGIPLALELAAARSAVTPPVRMLSELEHRLDVLVSRHRDAEPRHRSLRAAIEWSYRLLSEDLRLFYRRLSVFRGGWTVEAAHAVCAEPGAAEYLEDLRETSLVLIDETEQGMRYRMLEILREYADEQMSPEERWETRKRHRDHFLALTQQAGPELPGAKQAEWFARLEAEHDNIRAALEFCREDPDGAEPGMVIAGSMGAFWTWNGHVPEGWEHLRAALSHPNASIGSAAWAMAIVGAGHLGWSDPDPALYNRESLQKVVPILRQSGPAWGLAWALNALRNRFSTFETSYARSLSEEELTLARQDGLTAFIPRALDSLAETEWLALKMNHDLSSEDRAAAVIALWQEALECARAAGDYSLLARLLCKQAERLNDMGEVEGARASIEEARSLSLTHGNILDRTRIMMIAANFLRESGDYEQAKACYRDVEAVCRSAGHYSSLREVLGGLGNAAREQGDYVTARRYYEEEKALCIQHGFPSNPYLLHNLGRLTATEGDIEGGRTLLLQALSGNRAMDDRVMEANNLLVLGSLARREGDLIEARRLLDECLRLWRGEGTRNLLAYALEAHACLAEAEGEPGKAVRLYGAAEALREAIRKPMQPEDCPEHEAAIAQAREAMGADAFAVAWAEGRAMPLDAAMDCALNEPASP